MPNPFLDNDAPSGKNPFIDSDNQSYSTDSVRSAYQGAMNSLPVRAINGAVDAAASGASSLIPQKIKDKLSAAGDYFANKDKITSPIYTAVKEGATEIGEEVNDLSSYDQSGKGNLAHDLPALGENAKLLGNMALTKPLSEAAVKGAMHPIDTTGKVVDSALKVAGGAIKPVVKPVVRGMLESDNQVFGGGLNAARKSATAKEGEALGKRVGVNFSEGELTGNQAARNIEDALANSNRWSSRFTTANEEKTNTLVNKFKESLNKVSPNSTSQSGLGEKLTSAYKDTIDSLVQSRRSQAARDFKAAESATGGSPVIEPANFIKVLTKYIQEGESPTATREQVATSAQAKKALANITEKPAKPSVILDASGRPIERPAQPLYKKITVRDLQNGLEGYGDSAKSPGSISGGLKTASDRRFAREAKHAFENDLDAAADGGAGEGAAALKVARDHYKIFSGKIGDIQKTTLGKIVGSAERNSAGELVISSEKMSDKFLSMQPTEIKSTLKFLDSHHPDVANMARRYTLESAFNKAMEGKGQINAGMTRDFNKGEFLRALPDDDKLKAILGSSSAAGEVNDVASAMGRLVHYGASINNSKTALRTDILSRIGRFGLGTLYRSVVDDTLGEDLLNPQKRKALSSEAKKINDTESLHKDNNP